MRKRLRWLLLLVGSVQIIVVTVILVRAAWFQNQAVIRLDQVVRSDRRGAIVVAQATRNEAHSTGLIGRIEIPRLKLSTVVVEGTTVQSLLLGVGHLEHTAYPGEDDNVALAAHRDTYFRPLRNLKIGDQIRLLTPDGTLDYAVDSMVIVPPTRVDLVASTGRPNLTLVTCYPFFYIGHAPKRFVVCATRSDSTRLAEPVSLR